MSRKLHRSITSETHTSAVLETAASGGSKFGRPVALSTVRVANEDIDQLLATRIRNNPKVEVIESWNVDSSSTGPRSRYGKTLSALLSELPRHTRGEAIWDSGPLTPSGNGSEIKSLIDTIDATVRREKLDEVAQASRPQTDLASPDEYLARKNRNRGLRM
ncbi:hypothetical protein [Pseudomonas sp. Hp2]|uniref:hypothetical protein n=1 Tax=Pseudomonas sp. Hp2 TaxID=701189 RepID=UPI00112637B5|nr:hypothetical protein [Pseudomonas sp. Hp2]